MATNATLKKYQAAQQQALANYNVAKARNNQARADAKKIAAQLNKTKDPAKRLKLEKQFNAANQAVITTERQLAKRKATYSKAKGNVSKIKKSSAAKKKQDYTALKSKMMEKMQKDDTEFWEANMPYIMPTHPGSENSYVFVDNQTQTESSSTEITSNALSPGQYINHYTQMSPTQHQIDGKLGGALDSDVTELKKKYDMLKRWSENGTEVELHHGQRESNSAIITAVSANFDAPRDNAVPISITLQNVRWAKDATVTKSKGKTASKKKKKATAKKKTPTKGTRKKSNKAPGQYAVIKGGATTWAFHVKTGTAVTKLQNWNGFTGKLPEGKKMRVK